MNASDRDELIQTIKELARFYNKTLPSLSMRAYWESLKYLSLEQVKTALTKLYLDPPRYLPSAKALYMACQSGGDDRQTNRYGAGQRRRGEIAAIRAALEGREAGFTTKTGEWGSWQDGAACHIKLMGLKSGLALSPVHELTTEDLEFWLEKFRSEAAEDAENYGRPPDRGRAQKLKQAIHDGIG